jgi:hypothetical protein
VADQSPKQIHADIPTDRAWQVGRRIYIRCSKDSQLGQQLFEMHATWDPDVRARFVGTQRKALVIPLILEHLERIAAVDAVRAAGRWVSLPRGEGREEIHHLVKQLHGIYDGERKEWAMPSDEAFDQARAAIAEVTRRQGAAQAQQRQARAAQAAAEQAVMAAEAITRKEARHRRLIAESGRVATGVTGTVNSLRVPGRMNRAEAERRKPQPGDIRRLRGGRRVLVLESDIEFWSQDAIDDGLVSGGTDAEVGWYANYRYVVVELTAQEAAADARELAELADGQEICAVHELAKKTSVRVQTPTRVGPAVATINARLLHETDTGTITVTTAGDIWFQSYLWLDEPIHHELHITDPDLAARVRAIVAGGSRSRVTSPHMYPVTYTVTITITETGTAVAAAAEGAVL